MPYLLECTGCHRTTKALRVFRFSDLPGGFDTAPGDAPPNVYFAPRINKPGTYRRTLFGLGGRTNGVADVDVGLAELNNVDGRLDEMRLYAFDGYPLVISSIADRNAPFASRTRMLTGTMEQIEVTADVVRLKLRSRLALLDKPIQPLKFAGTTIDASKVEAEGGEDLKDAPRPLIFGAPLNVPAILVSRFFNILAIGQRFDAILRVRDKGGLLTWSGQDFTTIAALRSATVAGGQYATAKSLGLIRVGGNLAGQVTVDAVEGATPAQRTAAQVVRRILVGQAGLVAGTDFLDADLAALDALAPYEVETWTGTTNPTILETVSAILDSVGASISPDRLGIFRIGRFSTPASAPERTYGWTEIQQGDGVGIQRLATGDDGRGVPTKKITLQHSRNYAVVTENDLTGSTITSDAAFVAFAKEEWRQEVAESAAVAEVHKLAPEVTMQTRLVKAADAKLEVARRLTLYGTYRDRYQVPVPASEAEGVDLDDVVALRIDRFGLDAGVSFVVTGMLENLGEDLVTLDLWA
ncbi:hypothetical protein [Antarcticirhabdus aurantiaca]|uniref:Uncharacterized protein n=1 Tax=Antarcticirhabdus aurantiaca TaxID=2606717 RepID=A0ACD4NR49_9HYPH|nr:hypothetical protein OXU80_03605 [Jeongeuplla avenae]